MRLLLVAFAVVCMLAGTRAARAETRRVAVVVGQNVGATNETPLRYAEMDAGKIADVLVEVGEVDPADLFLVRGARRDTLRAAIDRAAAAIAKLRSQPDDRSLLVFYYSGHADGDVLHLGSERVTGQELRGWLRATKADVRLVVIDGCKSGSMIGKKGGSRAPTFDIKLADALDASGEALLTSSAADEVALESKEIRGSFFTHHLVSGLRGAADASGDDRVTLVEAYEYAFSHTLTATMQTGMAQHPAYEYRLSGQGDLVLARLSRPTATLELPQGFDRALVVLVKRDQVLVELTSDITRRVAVRPGEYAVRAWRAGRTFAGRAQVGEGQTRVVAWSELASVTPSPVAAKGGAAAGSELDDLVPEARAEYDEKFFQVADRVEVHGSSKGRVWTTDSYTVFRGKYRTKVGDTDLFRAAGRTDLAESYENRRLAQVAFVVAGVAAIGAGTARMLIDDDCEIGAAGFDGCFGTLGASIAAAGVLWVTAMVLTKAPLPAHEMRRMADEHNETLLRQLRARPVSALRLAPYAQPTGGGLGLSGRF